MRLIPSVRDLNGGPVAISTPGKLDLSPGNNGANTSFVLLCALADLSLGRNPIGFLLFR